MQGKTNLVIIDGRHACFKKRGSLGDIKDNSGVQEHLKASGLDEQALKLIHQNQEGFKFFVLFPTKKQIKQEFYSTLRSEHKNLFEGGHTTFSDVSQQDLQKQISSIVTSVGGNNSISSLSLVSHNLLKFQHGIESQSFPVHKILFSGYSQDFAKRKKLEEESYSKKIVCYHVSTLFQVSSAIKFLHKLCEETQKNNHNKPIVYNVGYYFDYSKMTQMNAYDLINAQYPYKYTPLDFRLPYNGPYPPYGVEEGDSNSIQFLVHKFQDFYKDKSEKAQELIKKQEQYFADFIKRFSEKVHIIDDTEKQDQIRSRTDFNDEMLSLLEQEETKKVLSKYPQIQVLSPKIVPFDPSTQNLQTFIESIQKDIIFPVLVKAVEASSSKESHFMAIVHNIESLKNFLTNSPMSKIKVIVQEMINHDNRINKLYVIGGHTELQVRVSIPNIDVEQYKGNDNAIWTFDSQKGFKEQLPIQVPDKLDNPHSTLNKELICELSQALRHYFKLNLFGYDIVQRVGTNEYYIIDLNYFPGFKNFQDVIGKFQNLYQDLIQKKQQNK